MVQSSCLVFPFYLFFRNKVKLVSSYTICTILKQIVFYRIKAAKSATLLDKIYIFQRKITTDQNIHLHLQVDPERSKCETNSTFQTSQFVCFISICEYSYYIIISHPISTEDKSTSQLPSLIDLYVGFVSTLLLFIIITSFPLALEQE